MYYLTEKGVGSKFKASEIERLEREFSEHVENVIELKVHTVGLSPTEAKQHHDEKKEIEKQKEESTNIETKLESDTANTSANTTNTDTSANTTNTNDLTTVVIKTDT